MKHTPAQRVANYDQRKAGADDIIADFVNDLRDELASGTSEMDAMRQMVALLHRAFREAVSTDARMCVTQALELLAFSILRQAKEPKP